MWIVLRAVYTLTPSYIFAAIFVYIFVHHIHLWTHSDVYILHLHSSVDVQRSLQCYSYIFAAIFVYIFVHPRLHSSVDAQRRLYSTTTLICGCTASYIHAYIHRGPSLALFSRWQRVHGYTSLIRPRLHSSLHSLHSTSMFSEHFRDPGVYIRPTFYIYILRTFSYIWHCSEPPELLVFVSFLYNLLYSIINIFANFCGSSTM